MSLTQPLINAWFNPKAQSDPWNVYLKNNPPPMDPFGWPEWYYKGQDKVAEYKGYKALGVEPNARFWSDDGQGFKTYGAYMGAMPSGQFQAFSGSRKKKRRRGGYRIPRR